MTSDIALIILAIAGVVALLIFGISRFMRKGMSIAKGSDFIGDAISGHYSGQYKRKALEEIRHEKEEARHVGAQGEKYDDPLPPVEDIELTGDERPQTVTALTLTLRVFPSLRREGVDAVGG